MEGSTGPLDNTAARSGLVPAVSSSSERSALALPIRNTQHTSRDLLAVWQHQWPVDRPPSGMGHVCCPRWRSRTPRARVSRVFVATPNKATVSPAGFAGANRRRPRTFFSRPCVCTGRLAQLSLQQAVVPRLAPSAGSSCSPTHTRGPLPSRRRERRPGFQRLPARGGGGSHRLAGPVACN